MRAVRIPRGVVAAARWPADGRRRWLGGADLVVTDIPGMGNWSDRRGSESRWEGPKCPSEKHGSTLCLTAGYGLWDSPDSVSPVGVADRATRIGPGGL